MVLALGGAIFADAWRPVSTDNEKTIASPAAAVGADEVTGDVYMVTLKEGIWRSTDGGAQFLRVDDGGGVTGGCASGNALNFDPAGKRVACLMLDGSCAVSLDLGKTWRVTRSPGRSWEFGAVDWHAAEPKTFVAMSHDSGGEVALSDDGGQSWRSIAKDPGIRAIGIFDQKTIVLGDAEGIRRSSDGGATWSKVSALRPVGRVMHLKGGAACWLAEGGLIRSKDQGVTWEKQGAPVEATWGPLFSGVERHLVVVGRRGFFETNDGGVTWNLAAPLPNVPGSNAENPGQFTSLSWDPLHNVFFAARTDWGTQRLERGWPVRRRVVAFGDSNTHGWTENTVGWSDGLDRLVPGTQVIMAGQKGRRVGMGVTDIDRVLKSAGHVDEVLISLGTDDAGEERMAAAGGTAGLAASMEQIIVKIKAYHAASPDEPAPVVTLVTPPPFGSQLNQMNREKYGANPNQSLEEMIPLYRELALKHGVRYFDLYAALRADVDHLIWIDGLHYRARATVFPRLIGTFLSDTSPPAPPADLKMSEGRLAWTASPSADVLGYEILVDGKVVGTSVEATAPAPAGAGVISVRARDGIGLRSDAISLR